MGAKNAEFEIMGQATSQDAKEISKYKQNSALQDIINGKETKQVQEFRYRHYMVLREANNFMRDKDRRQLHHLEVDPYDNFPVELGVITKNVTAGITESYGDKEYTNILFENNNSDFQMGKFSEKVVVRNIDNQLKLVEIWFNKLQNPDNTQALHLLTEIGRMVNNPIITPLTNISKVGFLTQNAYGVDDFLYYEYEMRSLYKVLEHKNYYIIKYVAEPTINGEDILATKYYDKDASQQIIMERWVSGKDKYI